MVVKIIVWRAVEPVVAGSVLTIVLIPVRKVVREDVEDVKVDAKVRARDPVDTVTANKLLE
jgi:hypothetical protein